MPEGFAFYFFVFFFAAGFFAAVFFAGDFFAALAGFVSSSDFSSGDFDFLLVFDSFLRAFALVFVDGRLLIGAGCKQRHQRDEGVQKCRCFFMIRIHFFFLVKAQNSSLFLP